MLPRLLTALFLCFLAVPAPAEDEAKHPLAELPLRNIGPGLISGRISDFAFHPEHKHVYYAAIASGGLFKTQNNGTTWTALFEKEGSYALGVVELDPNNPQVVWVGTGENNSQRSVGYGDGVYKSHDGGNSWSNMGLKNSGHISQIWIDPEDSARVRVAAQGPLWSDGGDRGLYKTIDGGEKWERILNVDEHTGINEFVVDPNNNNRIVASSYQRRRHVWTLINGGPGSGIHRSEDGGKTWTEISSGLPKDNMGRIGLAGAPTEPNRIYAIIEANDDERGIYHSSDFGLNWEKRSDHHTSSPQYYNELVVDPTNADRVFSPDTFTFVSENGGRSWSRLGVEHRHVDDHALWIDPGVPEHMYIGGDGGIYESFDNGANWRHISNLPIAQFYRIQPDYGVPFYNVCGGTQDNNSLCGPSRTTVRHGITNSDWTLILGGDGYEPQFDPDDPDTIYAQYQYGGLARYNKVSGERVFIAPHPASGENDFKWNWSTPLIVSPHNSKRLYYAAEKLFRSDDRGDSWSAVSEDLTRKLDRNALEVMGRVWSVDTIAKNKSTSIYGAAIALSESTLEEGLIYVGTDDGVMNVTENGGKTWRRTMSFNRVPDMSLIEDVVASMHDADVAYATIDNHKRGDYKPYVLKTDNRGRTWSLISNNLPERGSAHTIVEDHANPNLLFVGTEFGVYFSQDTGASWHALKSNFPTIAVRDLEIQRRENDLVIGTFGRGIYVLDDYTALRTPADDIDPLHLFEVRDAWSYVVGDKLGYGEKGFRGGDFYNEKNPPFGAVFTYYIDKEIKTAAATRRASEIEAEEAGEDTPYPSWDELRTEDREDEPQVLLVVRNDNDEVVRYVNAETSEGLHRTAWNLRWPTTDPVSLSKPDFSAPWASKPQGPLAAPGVYSVTLAVRRDGTLKEVGDAQTFRVKSLLQGNDTSSDLASVVAFQRKAGELYRAVKGAGKLTDEIAQRIEHLKAAIQLTPSADSSVAERLRSIELRLDNAVALLKGDSTIASRSEPTAWSISRRTDVVYESLLDVRSDVPAMYEQSYQIASKEFKGMLKTLKSINTDLGVVEAELESLGAPHTPGRVPDWP
ncbi:MAG: glycosyl hydrolase [Gammaproteobacteria bacterium]